MTTQQIDGRVDQAFGHLLLVGLCAISEHQGMANCRIQWTGTMDPCPILHFDGTWPAVCQAVNDHAAKVHADLSWIHEDIAITKKKPTGTKTTMRALFSPRIGTPDREGWWADYVERRATALDRMTGQPVDWLGLRLVGALGMPAYWGPVLNKKLDVDYGASRWEMKTRNIGMEFVSERFRALAAAVADRTPDEISQGLLGQTHNDEHGKPTTADSRLATGLRSPGPVDAVTAWCALWGLSQFPICHHVRALSGTAGYVGRFSGGHFVLPVPGAPTRLSRYRAIVTGAHTQNALPETLLDQRSAAAHAERQASLAWLADRSVAALVAFPMHVTSNQNAPERWAEVGTVVSTSHGAWEPIRPEANDAGT